MSSLAFLMPVVLPCRIVSFIISFNSLWTAAKKVALIFMYVRVPEDFAGFNAPQGGKLPAKRWQ